LRIQSGYFGVKGNDAWIDELLSGLGLADKAGANMRQLSGGMKRRVLVAQALVHRPPVIVLDEPTAGVDVELRQTLWQFIARLNRQGHTVLLTTHYLEEAEALCGRIAMLKQGRVVALDRTSNLLAGTSSTMLRFKTDDPLPAAIAAHARVTGRIAQVKARDAADVEQTLATLRTAGVRIEDLEIGRADLEDVFLDIMQGGRA
jgi:ABC-2 type transport system ATP-binding protein